MQNSLISSPSARKTNVQILSVSRVVTVGGIPVCLSLCLRQAYITLLSELMNAILLFYSRVHTHSAHTYLSIGVPVVFVNFLDFPFFLVRLCNLR
jgi:hypothetical protein